MPSDITNDILYYDNLLIFWHWHWWYFEILSFCYFDIFCKLNNQTLQHIHFHHWGWFSGMVWVPRVLNIKQLVWPWVWIFPCKLGELIIFLLAICSRPEKLNAGTCWTGGTYIPLVPKSNIRYYTNSKSLQSYLSVKATPKCTVPSKEARW